MTSTTTGKENDANWGSRPRKGTGRGRHQFIEKQALGGDTPVRLGFVACTILALGVVTVDEDPSAPFFKTNYRSRVALEYR